MRSLLRAGSSISVFGLVRFASQISVLDAVFLGSAIALRSFARCSSALSVLDFVNLGPPRLGKVANNYKIVNLDFSNNFQASSSHIFFQPYRNVLKMS